MNTYTLENENLKATFQKKGAELVGLHNNETEFIWQADPSFWNRHTPVLFPIVGSLKGNTYFIGEDKFEMNQHGFARDREFTIISHTKNTIIFELVSSNETLKNYPFEFILQIQYTLNDKSLDTKYIVKNPSNTKMLFSIGAHPAYACPFDKEHTREEYILVFDNDAAPESQLLTDGGRSHQTSKVFNQGGVLDLPKHVFNNDAIILNPNPFSEVSFIHEPTGKTYMTVSFQNFPYLGIWSKSENSPFICIEPWHGIADHAEHNQQLKDKEGIISLEAKEEFSCNYLVTIP